MKRLSVLRSASIPLIAAFSLAVATSCGVREKEIDGGGAATTSPRTTSPRTTTDPTPATTQPPTTTVLATTTTTPPDPWTVVEFPELAAPSLTAAVGGPRAVRTVCLDMTLDGFGLDGIDDLTWTLEQMGLTVVETGCDVTLRVDVSGTRISAGYTRGGTSYICWPGYRMSGEVTLLDATSQLGTWSVQHTFSPPQTIQSCTPQDASIGQTSWAVPTAVALTESFGPAAGVLTHVQLAPTSDWDDDHRVDVIRTSPDAAATLQALLGHEEWSVRAQAAAQLEGWASAVIMSGQQFPAELWSTIPYLVAAGVGEFDGEFDFQTMQTLSTLFFLSPDAEFPVGFDPNDPAEWWAMWEQRPTP